MIISPSILAANFGRLDDDIEMLNDSQADWIHIDVMDGVFVPNISIGFPVIEAVAAKAKKPLDVHLMIAQPERYIEQCKQSGASIVNVHQEACIHLDRVINQITEAGMFPAVTLCPSTPIEMLRNVITEVHMVLLMSVNPGFGGQKFIPNTLNKVRRLREMIDSLGSHALIEIDGGVNMETGLQLAESGADVLVAGSAVFQANDPRAYISQLKGIKA